MDLNSPHQDLCTKGGGCISFSVKNWGIIPDALKAVLIPTTTKI